MKDLFGEEIIEPQKRGGGDSVYKIIGASNHCAESRQEDDFYATNPKAVDMLCDLEKFSPNVWEPCCGQGHIAKVLTSRGYDVRATDLVDRGYGLGMVDFLTVKDTGIDTDIISNPPYSMAQQFVEKALNVVSEGHKVAMFLKLTFAEGKTRRALFDKFPPKTVYVSSSRLECGKNGIFGAGSAVCYAWWVWVKGYKGPTEMRWFN